MRKLIKSAKKRDVVVDGEVLEALESYAFYEEELEQLEAMHYEGPSRSDCDWSASEEHDEEDADEEAEEEEGGEGSEWLEEPREDEEPMMEEAEDKTAEQGDGESDDE
jgi:hypothetical protein